MMSSDWHLLRFVNVGTQAAATLNLELEAGQGDCNRHFASCDHWQHAELIVRLLAAQHRERSRVPGHSAVAPDA